MNNICVMPVYICAIILQGIQLNTKRERDWQMELITLLYIEKVKGFLASQEISLRRTLPILPTNNLIPVTVTCNSWGYVTPSQGSKNHKMAQIRHTLAEK